jgi:hypothetical protein
MGATREFVVIYVTNAQRVMLIGGTARNWFDTE